jgi:phosphoglycerate dehydrogenase-like enzyme
VATRTIDTILIQYPRAVGGRAHTGLTERHLAELRSAAPEATLVHADDAEWRANAARLGPSVHVALGWIDPDQIRALHGLRWLQQTGAGADWLLRAPDIAASDLVVTNASGVHAIPISEHILALMLTLSRRIHRFVKAQHEREWLRRGRLGELDGATLGIVGLGAIGEKTAQKAKGLGMRVLGLRRHPERTSPHVDRMFGPDELPVLLGESDWVVLAAALTSETRAMIGAAELAAMKSSAYLVNIARGGMVDEKALIEALATERIAGAGLDVFEQEPLPQDSPLWGMRNVVITPHFAGATLHYTERILAIFVDNLGRYRRGDPLRNLVDKQLGY